jgi:superfamily II DNA/RNA helicase
MQQKNIKTLVFCNTVKSLLELQYYCEAEGINVVTLHSQLAKKMRLINYQRFRDSEDNLMLSTDLGARGLHFPGLQRVINYDFPLSTTDYLQRVGRTGRAGKNGLAITIYRKHDIDVINELKGSSFNKPIKISNSAYSLKNR